jgi:hypothetical protein
MTLRAAIYLGTSFALSLTADEQTRDLRQLAADRADGMSSPFIAMARLSRENPPTAVPALPLCSMASDAQTTTPFWSTA